MTITEALADAEARLGAAQAEYQSLQHEAQRIQQSAQAVNARGIAAERTILGIEGEIKALKALTDGE